MSVEKSLAPDPAPSSFPNEAAVLLSIGHRARVENSKALSPRAQQGRPNGWSSSSVRECSPETPIAAPWSMTGPRRRMREQRDWRVVLAHILGGLLIFQCGLREHHGEIIRHRAVRML